jgi:hypothetical protein
MIELVNVAFWLGGKCYTTNACNLRVRQASIGPRSARNNLLVLSTHRRPKRSLAKCAGSRRSWDAAHRRSKHESPRRHS